MKKFIIIALAMVSVMINAAEKPLLRAGIITDTHVTPNPKSVDKLRAALKLFKEQEVDVVMNLAL